MKPHATLAPSPWVMRFAPLTPSGGRILDLACGRGRHSRALLESGFVVTAVDRDTSGLDDISGAEGLNIVEADLEAGPWPLAHTDFDAVVVTNYLHRPLLPAICAAVAPGGLLIYETFAVGNEKFGRPRNPDYLLRRGELLDLAHGRMDVLAYEDLTVEEPQRAAIQRICARV